MTEDDGWRCLIDWMIMMSDDRLNDSDDWRWLIDWMMMMSDDRLNDNRNDGGNGTMKWWNDE